MTFRELPRGVCLLVLVLCGACTEGSQTGDSTSTDADERSADADSERDAEGDGNFSSEALARMEAMEAAAASTCESVELCLPEEQQCRNEGIIPDLAECLRAALTEEDPEDVDAYLACDEHVQTFLATCLEDCRTPNNPDDVDFGSCAAELGLSGAETECELLSRPVDTVTGPCLDYY